MASKYIGMLMSSRNQAHTFHLTTALQAYYEGIIPLADAWAEAYMGRYGRLTKISFNKKTVSDPRKAKAYFKSLLTRVRAIKLPRDSYLKNIQDEIMALIRSTLYMLTLK